MSDKQLTHIRALFGELRGELTDVAYRRKVADLSNAIEELRAVEALAVEAIQKNRKEATCPS